MKRPTVLGAFVLFAVMALASCAIGDEKDVLKALEKVKGAVESGVTYVRYGELLADAKAEINMLKRSEKQDKCFVDAVEIAYAHFQQAKGTWEQVQQAEGNRAEAERLLKQASSMGLKSKEAELREALESSERLLESKRALLQYRWAEASASLDKAYECLSSQ